MGQMSRAEREKKTDSCGHTHTVTTFVAGLARSVCESCGKVSIRYLGEGAFFPDLHPNGDGETTDEPAPATAVTDITKRPNPICKRCEADAYFITPWGLACGEHAWEAASRQDPLSGDFWIPLLIDRSDIPR